MSYFFKIAQKVIFLHVTHSNALSDVHFKADVVRKEEELSFSVDTEEK